MMTLLLIIIYISFISLGLPDSLLGSAWPVMYGELQVPVSFAGIISMIIAGGTIISSFFSEKIDHTPSGNRPGYRHKCIHDRRRSAWLLPVSFRLASLYPCCSLRSRSGKCGCRPE